MVYEMTSMNATPLTVDPSLRGRVAVLIGGAGAIGSATATAFAEHGAQLAILDSDQEHARALAGDLHRRGLQAWVFEADALDDGQAEPLLARVRSELGRVDIFMYLVGW